MGVKRVRYNDTVGILYPKRILNHIKIIREEVPLEVEIYAQNNFGMAIANSLGAVEGGAQYVDCKYFRQ